MEDFLPLLGCETENVLEKKPHLHSWNDEDEEQEACDTCKERLIKAKNSRNSMKLQWLQANHRFKSANDAYIKCDKETVEILKIKSEEIFSKIPSLSILFPVEEKLSIVLAKRTRACIILKRLYIDSIQRHSKAFWQYHNCIWKKQRKFQFSHNSIRE